MDAGTHQFVDGALDRGHVGRQHGNPFAVADLGQFFGEARWVGGIQAMRDLGDVGMPEIACRLRDLPLDQIEEWRRVRRQYEGESRIGAAAWPARLLRGAELFDHLYHALHRFGIDARAPVEHPVYRGRAHAGDACDVGDGGC